MRGITEERLRELRDGGSSPAFERTLKWLVHNECIELNPWQPIDTAPLGKHIRLFRIATKEQDEGTLRTNIHRQYYSHWQELPEDPK